MSRLIRTLNFYTTKKLCTLLLLFPLFGPAAQLSPYTGSYRMEKGPAHTVYVEGGGLKGKLGHQAPFKLLAERENHFYVKAIDSDVLFVRNETAQITELKIHQQRKSINFKKMVPGDQKPADSRDSSIQAGNTKNVAIVPDQCPVLIWAGSLSLFVR